MRCQKFWIRNDGKFACNTSMRSGGFEYDVRKPHPKLNAAQRRQAEEWKEAKEVIGRISDYFEVYSYEPGSLHIRASFTAPFGAEDIHNKIRVNVLEIAETLNKGGIEAKVDRWGQARDPRFYQGRGHLTWEEMIEQTGHVWAQEDWVWKLLIELKTDEDIGRIIEFVAGEIDARGLSEHVVFLAPTGEPFL